MSEYEDEYYETSRSEATEDSYNAIVFRLDPRPTLEIIRRNLLMQNKYDEETRTWKRHEGVNPMFDEAGIDELMAKLYARMSVDKVLSTLEENNVRIIVREIGEVVIEFVYSNASEYGIDKKQYNDIHYLIKHNIELFLRRAIKGKENELLNKSFSATEVVNRSTRVAQNEGQDRGRSLHNPLK